MCQGSSKIITLFRGIFISKLPILTICLKNKQNIVIFGVNLRELNDKEALIEHIIIFLNETLEISQLQNCNVIVLNSMFCLNRDCVLIISLYRERFYLWSSKVSSSIGNIVISKIVISGFCPIYFTVTFART